MSTRPASIARRLARTRRRQESTARRTADLSPCTDETHSITDAINRFIARRDRITGDTPRFPHSMRTGRENVSLSPDASPISKRGIVLLPIVYRQSQQAHDSLHVNFTFSSTILHP